MKDDKICKERPIAHLDIHSSKPHKIKEYI